MGIIDLKQIPQPSGENRKILERYTAIMGRLNQICDSLAAGNVSKFNYAILQFAEKMATKNDQETKELILDTVVLGEFRFLERALAIDESSVNMRSGVGRFDFYNDVYLANRGFILSLASRFPGIGYEKVL